jgi:hypothetical protein
LVEIHKVKMRLATGEIKTYFYAWRGCPQIKAKPGTPDFVGAYNDAHARLRQPRTGTLMTVIAEYKASPEFTRLAPSSRRAYLIYIKLIENEFGDLPLAAGGRSVGYRRRDRAADRDRHRPQPQGRSRQSSMRTISAATFSSPKLRC